MAQQLPKLAPAHERLDAAIQVVYLINRNLEMPLPEPIRWYQLRAKVYQVQRIKALIQEIVGE